MSDAPMLGEDDRFQVEFTAQQTERKNRSSRLIVLGLLLLVVCGFVWIWGWRAESSAVATLRAKQREQVRIQTMLDRIEAIQADGAGKTVEGEIIINMGSRLKSIAVDKAGLPEDGLPLPNPRTVAAAGGNLQTYRYEGVTSPTLEPIIEWLLLATDEDEGIDGLEIYSLDITPNKARKQSEADVVFRRWERAQ